MRVTKKLYNQILAEQGGVCACCKKAEDPPLVVDRAYYTREVRGLICKRCRKILTNVKDSVELLRRLDAYSKGEKLPPLDKPLR
jgi:hypothetical protein